MQLRRHVKLGFILILIGMTPLLYTTYRTFAHNWTPLTVPVILTPGEFQSPDFKTDLTGTYIVSLVFERGLPFGKEVSDKERCMIGDDFPKGSCNSDTRTLYVNWSVVPGTASMGLATEYKPGTFSFTSDKIEAELGRFEAKRGNPQKITLKILRNAGTLNAAHPKLKVEAHRIYWEEWIILGQLAFLWAIVLGAVGVGCIVLPRLFRRGKTRPSI